MRYADIIKAGCKDQYADSKRFRTTIEYIHDNEGSDKSIIHVISLLCKALDAASGENE